MAKLNDTAALLQDLYFQNYRSDEDFFTEEHFVYICGVIYSKLLEEEYKEARRLAIQEEGISTVTMQSDWLTEEKVKFEKKGDGSYYEAKLSKKVFSFPYDRNSQGIQNIINISGQGCSDFIRTSVLTEWMDDLLPKTNKVFWFKIGDVIRAFSGCKLGEAQVFFIAEADENAEIPSSKEQDIIDRGWTLLARARQGVVIDMSNNSNPNKEMELELGQIFQKVR